MPAKSSRLVRKTVVFTSRSRVEPASSRIAPRFVNTCSVCSAMVGSTIAEQTEQVLTNLGAILEEAGSSLDRLVKTTVFLTSLDDFAGMNEVYARHVGDRPPARSTIEVSKLPSGALVEIEAVAHL